MHNRNLIHTISHADIQNPRIKVIGLGGAGCNTIQRLSRLKIPEIDLVAANTDSLALSLCDVDSKILLGKNLTGGHGAGGIPEIGKQAAEENYRELIQQIKGANILFLTAGMGGGTGSGAIQIAARIARSMDIPAIGMVTLPFSFESGHRTRSAAEAVACLQPFLNTLITIPNDRLLTLCTREMRLEAALSLADDILIQGISGISGLVRHHGRLNIDLSHLLRLMRGQGGTFIATACGDGPSKTIRAIREALKHPLLDGIPIQEAKGVIIKFSGGVTITDITDGLTFLKTLVPEETEIITAVDDNRQGSEEIQVMMLVTGIGAKPMNLSYPEEPSGWQAEELISFRDTEYQVKPADNHDSTNSEDLSVPAFIRRGYNLVTTGITSHATTDA
jgi:cell division protein FtsZ